MSNGVKIGYYRKTALSQVFFSNSFQFSEQKMNYVLTLRDKKTHG